MNVQTAPMLDLRGPRRQTSGMPSPPDITSIEPTPSLVLFDLDDTLCDYASARQARLRRAFGDALAAAGVTADDLLLERLAGESIAIHPHGADHFHEVLRPHGVIDPGIAREATAWYRENRFHGLALFPDAVETVRAVRQAHPGRRIGMITNGPTDVQRAKIDLLGIAPEIDFIIVSGEFGVDKPDPAIFRAALAQGGVDPAGAVMIGDNAVNDIVGAHGVGMAAIWIDREGAGWPLDAPAPGWITPDLAGVRALLAGG